MIYYIQYKRLYKDSIIQVKLVSGTVLTKTQVIADIVSGRNQYKTYPGGAEVFVKNGYITTKPNDTTRDNLDELPNF